MERSSKGVMDEGPGKLQKASTHPALHKRETYIGNVSETSSNGVMEEGSSKVPKASTHPLRTHEQTGRVRERSSNGVMEEGIGKVQKASAYPLCAQEASRTCQRKCIQRGDGRRFREGS